MIPVRRAPSSVVRTVSRWCAVLFAVVGTLGCAPSGRTEGGHTAAATGAGSAGTSVRSEVGFRTPELLDEHYRKHGREFGGATRDEYLRIAQSLRDRPRGGDVLEQVRADGVVTRFDRHDGTFVAFDPDGVIRTCFRPSDGERYFRRQALRHGG